MKTKRGKQRQYIWTNEEATEYYNWYQAQPVDPMKRWVDPIAAFRAQKRRAAA